MKNETYLIRNLNNQEDADKLTQAVLSVWGISKAEANTTQKTVLFSYDERMASARDFIQAIKESGYDIVNE
ncbi:heavy-metal-associated domain-containing protein [Metabacillus halosaccharovorans]|uniref:Heavy-metal-associated domain-containing protein n=1 Tax=Metabacillus halosaccharovorans TaxID=930124 RepID=A0ABT3DC02_9BACI|nr:heavy-metal-associated domain-containing protein [Metabacillus halosaccharovorans]MCV9884363.1 heavy-metal-associated domain-containing protein [Metabacillus halosaccharovorans]